MKKLSFISLIFFGFATVFTKAQNFEHKTLISAIGNFSQNKATSVFDNTVSSTNSSRILQTEISAVYFLGPKIGVGFSGSLNNFSTSYVSQQTTGLFSSSSTDSNITRETGGAIRLDLMLIEKSKFSFGFKCSGGTYIMVRRSVFVSESVNPPTTFTNTREQTTKGNVLRIAVVPVLYYEISKHVLAQLQYASIFYSKTNSELMPPANQNSTVETNYGLNLNSSSLALGLSLLF